MYFTLAYIVGKWGKAHILGGKGECKILGTEIKLLFFE